VTFCVVSLKQKDTHRYAHIRFRSFMLELTNYINYQALALVQRKQ